MVSTKELLFLSDGIKSLNVVTDLEKAYTTEGRSLVVDFEKKHHISNCDEAWKNTYVKWTN